MRRLFLTNAPAATFLVRILVDAKSFAARS